MTGAGQPGGDFATRQQQKVLGRVGLQVVVLGGDVVVGDRDEIQAELLRAQGHLGWRQAVAGIEGVRGMGGMHMQVTPIPAAFGPQLFRHRLR